jgi:hypothetical protein
VTEPSPQQTGAEWSPPPEKLKPLECSSTLYYRPVDNPIAEFFNETHSYWQVQVYDPNSGVKLVDEIISGGRYSVVDPSTGNETTYLVSGSMGPMKASTSLRAARSGSLPG